MPRKYIIGFIAAAFLLVTVSAGASAYITHNVTKEEVAIQPAKKTAVTKTEKITWNEPTQAPAPAAQAQLPPCDDNNIVGQVAGGVIGGIAGSQIGKGNGNTAATIGGAVGGAYLGGQYLPTQNVTCR